MIALALLVACAEYELGAQASAPLLGRRGTDHVLVVDMRASMWDDTLWVDHGYYPDGFEGHGFYVAETVAVALVGLDPTDRLLVVPACPDEALAHPWGPWNGPFYIPAEKIMVGCLGNGDVLATLAALGPVEHAIVLTDQDADAAPADPHPERPDVGWLTAIVPAGGPCANPIPTAPEWAALADEVVDICDPAAWPAAVAL